MQSSAVVDGDKESLFFYTKANGSVGNTMALVMNTMVGETAYIPEIGNMENAMALGGNTTAKGIFYTTETGNAESAMEKERNIINTKL